MACIVLQLPPPGGRLSKAADQRTGSSSRGLPDHDRLADELGILGSVIEAFLIMYIYIYIYLFIYPGNYTHIYIYISRSDMWNLEHSASNVGNGCSTAGSRREMPVSIEMILACAGHLYARTAMRNRRSWAGAHHALEADLSNVLANYHYVELALVN